MTRRKKTEGTGAALEGPRIGEIVLEIIDLKEQEERLCKSLHPIRERRLVLLENLQQFVKSRAHPEQIYIDGSRFHPFAADGRLWIISEGSHVRLEPLEMPADLSTAKLCEVKK